MATLPKQIPGKVKHSRYNIHRVFRRLNNIMATPIQLGIA